MIPYAEISRLLMAVALRLPGAVLPETYTVFDLETSGLSVETDRAVSVGLCVFEHRKPVWLSSRILYRPVLRLSEKAVSIHGINQQVMQEKGEEPAVVLKDLLKTVAAAPVLLGWNAYRFDCPMLRKDLNYFCDHAASEFDKTPLLDVGLLLKAALAREPVFRSDTLPSLWERVAAKRSSVKWSMDWATDALKLSARPDRHDAGDDAERTGLIFEKLREVGGV